MKLKIFILAGLFSQQVIATPVSLTTAFIELAKKVRDRVVNISSIKLKIFILAGLFSQQVIATPVSLTTAFIELAKKVRDRVVNISSIKQETKNIVQIFPGYFVPYYTAPKKGSGSGFIVDKKGYIITNFHVVKNFDKIQVQFFGDSKFYPATILGTDSFSDIALLKVHTKKRLTAFKFGDSEKLQVGQWVAAIGNPHNLGHTMTKGIISAVKREMDELNLFPLLQTDASINLGNSGGPLINLKGEVIGVNQAILQSSNGIGFAIPINNVKQVFKDLKSFGFVKRGFIGVEFYQKPGTKQVIVTKVLFNSPAYKAGLKQGDQIVKLDKTKIQTQKDLPKAVRKLRINKQVSLHILRHGLAKKLKISSQLLNKDMAAPVKKISIKANLMPGGFKIARLTFKLLKQFQLPDLGIKNPIVIYVKPGSLAQQAGLKQGDLLYQINNQTILKLSQVKTTLKQAVNYVKILRYHHKYDKYFSISLRIKL